MMGDWASPLITARMKKNPTLELRRLLDAGWMVNPLRGHPVLVPPGDHEDDFIFPEA